MSTVDVAQALYLLLAALGLSLAVSWAGLPVLGAGAFLAVGGYGTALLGPGGQGWPLGLAVLASVLLGGVVGHLVALGASRLEGPSLALATWALAWLVQRTLLAYPDRFGGSDGLTRPSPPHLVSHLLGLDLVLTPRVHVVLAGLLCLAAMAALVRVSTGPGGLDLAALREGPALALSLGIPVARRRRTVVAVAAAVVALAGAGNLLLLGLVEPTDVSPLVSLQLFVAVLLGGTARWWGPVLGVAVITALPHLADALARSADVDPERSRSVLTAALLVLVLVLRAPIASLLARPGRRPGTPIALDVARAVSSGEIALLASDLRVSYAGVNALDGVALELRTGEVHALIGPNGSGKSTLLKALSGELQTGTIDLLGAPLTGSVDRRARAGVVRTAQHTDVLGLPAEGQVAVGARGGRPAAQAVLRHLLATPISRSQPDLVAPALQEVGLAHVAGADPAQLRFGDQRLLQVARAVATGATVLLLDEPAAGMSADERARLRDVLRGLAASGRAVLLVEHDMRLVAEVADRVTVLDQGRVVLTGTAEQVRADPRVRAVYLGSGPTV